MGEITEMLRFWFCGLDSPKPQFKNPAVNDNATLTVFFVIEITEWLGQ